MRVLWPNLSIWCDERYQDDENGFEYENTRIVEFKGHIVAYRAPVLENNQLGLEEKAPIHVADVVRMVEENCLYQSQLATSGDTTLKNNYHGHRMVRLER